MSKTCSTCKHYYARRKYEGWVAFSKDDDNRYNDTCCLRYPMPLRKHPSDRCGEHKKRKIEKPKED